MTGPKGESAIWQTDGDREAKSKKSTQRYFELAILCVFAFKSEESQKGCSKLFWATFQNLIKKTISGEDDIVENVCHYSLANHSFNFHIQQTRPFTVVVSRAQIEVSLKADFVFMNLVFPFLLLSIFFPIKSISQRTPSFPDRSSSRSYGTKGTVYLNHSVGREELKLVTL